MVPSPMKQQWFHILLALSERDRHGYGIQRAVLEQTDGAMRLWPAMLYRSLGKLEEAGLIVSTAAPEEDVTDERRQYYSLTGAGRERLAAEVDLLASWVKTARKHERT